jgi:glycine/D-amino acid oxidase-like deaminating enzyme
MVRNKVRIAVIGAGAFGGWSAFHLLQGGAEVTLIDAWGAGNSRASSGGETRIIRGGYGPNQPYTRMAARALQLWREHEQRWQRKFLYTTGVLWMAGDDDAFEKASLLELRAAGLPFEELSPKDLQRRWPQINFEGVKWAFLELEGGYLAARAACQAVVEQFIARGGELRLAAALPPRSWDGRSMPLSDGSVLRADVYVFACGPWLGKMFPDVIGENLCVTKQEVFFFGPPQGDNRFDDAHLPVWADHRERFFYGIPGNQGRGFKIADDTRGPVFDPTSGERVVSHENLRTVREYLAFRFPALHHAPLVETRVCQYENTPDNHLIIDRHPEAENVWLVGGGSGHGYKHGPAVGELVTGLVLADQASDPTFSLKRFQE